jgi:hypothetical protein
MIPPLVILNAGDDRYVLLSLSLQDSKYVQAKVVDNSKYLFTSAEWRSDGLEGQPKNYIFRRVSSRSATTKDYASTLRKTINYLIVPWHEPIYIYTMTYSGVILPSTYFRVFRNDDTEEKWHFKKPSASSSAEASPALPPVPAPAKIPSHIILGFVESAIQKKEICPITLDALVMGNIAMTSCGHLFEKQGLLNMLSSTTACPTCRAPIKQEDLVIV